MTGPAHRGGQIKRRRQQTQAHGRESESNDTLRPSGEQKGCRDGPR
jgi:hypothetical protein